MTTQVYLGYPPSNIKTWIQNKYKTFVTYTEDSELEDWSGTIQSTDDIPNKEYAKTIRLGNAVKSIGDYAFTDCSSLTSVTIPNSVQSIGYESFAWLSDEVSFPLQTKETIRSWFNDWIFGSNWGPVTIHCSNNESVYAKWKWDEQVGDYVWNVEDLISEDL